LDTGPLVLARVERPVFVVGSPRSGTTLLQNLMCRDPSIYKLGRESRFLWHQLGGQEVTGIFPDRDRIASTFLSQVYRGERAWTMQEQFRWAQRCASQGTPAQYLDLPHELAQELSTQEIGPFANSVQTETAPFTVPPLGAVWATDTDGPVRIVDKDTGHCWRLPELADTFPDAQFVFVVREPEEAIRSLMAGWRHPTWFFTYRMEVELNISGYSSLAPWARRWWNFNLFPGWEKLVNASLEEVAAQQWESAVNPVIDHGIPLIQEGRAIITTYERIVTAPTETLGTIAEFTGLDADALIGNGLDKNYMSMRALLFDAGSGDIGPRAARARSLLEPFAQFLPSGTT